MATIWDKIVIDSCQRPAYTSYELSKMVVSKRTKTGLSLEKFAELSGVSSKILASIEAASRNFNFSMYEVCSKVLNMELNEILRKDFETVDCIEYRTDSKNEEVLHTVDFANQIFNEMVMQYKISAR